MTLCVVSVCALKCLFDLLHFLSAGLGASVPWKATKEYLNHRGTKIRLTQNSDFGTPYDLGTL